jgi:hypothetical protein
MFSLNTQTIKALENYIQNKFDKISIDFLGILPNFVKDKKIVLSIGNNSLTSLFLQALGTRNPNRVEENTLKSLISIANKYLESIKDKTTAKIISDIDGYVREQSLSDQPISRNKMGNLIIDGLKESKKQIELTIGAESQKSINVGSALQIKKVAESREIEDPVVYFNVTIDDVTGDEEFKLHLLPDRKTPRVWLLSELKGGYHRRGDKEPKLSGLHPLCRCKLLILLPNWGFDEDGHIKYKGNDWDEFKYQREKFGLPR